ncbi:MAG: hypothetical protein ACRDD7_03600 [Peptostreptococcaceae bacterium]
MREVNMDNVTYGYKEVDGRKEIDYEKWIDLSGLPIYTSGRYKGKIDWSNCVECQVGFKYQEVKDYIKIIKYNKNSRDLTVRYNNEDFNIKTVNFTKIQLGNLLREKTSEFKIEIGQVFKDDKRDLIITERKYFEDKGGRKWKVYKYKCNKCGFECGECYKNGQIRREFFIRENHLLKNGNGCACCHKSITDIRINSIVSKKETMWMVDYFKGGYEEAKKFCPRSEKKLYFKCPDCGEVKIKEKSIGDLFYNKSIGCSCSDKISYPNKFLRHFTYELKKIYNIDFYFEYKIDNSSYDGYIKYNNIEYLIEMDGGQHKNFKNRLSRRNEIKNDLYKDSLARNNGFKLIRIDCEFSDMYFIKNNIVKSDLNNIFDLSKIDWVEIDKLSLKNIVKEVCDYWRNKEEWENVTTLASNFGLNRTTVLRYLKRGINHGWCNYNADEELKKTRTMNGKMKGKKIKVTTSEGALLGIFDSCSEFSRISSELFGYKINTSNISLVANGKASHYKGLGFKYIEENQNIAS